jgi:hypothetical protein
VNSNHSYYFKKKEASSEFPQQEMNRQTNKPPNIKFDEV